MSWRRTGSLRADCCLGDQRVCYFRGLRCLAPMAVTNDTRQSASTSLRRARFQNAQVCAYQHSKLARAATSLQLQRDNRLLIWLSTQIPSFSPASVPRNNYGGHVEPMNMDDELRQPHPLQTAKVAAKPVSLMYVVNRHSYDCGG